MRDDPLRLRAGAFENQIEVEGLATEEVHGQGLDAEVVGQTLPEGGVAAGIDDCKAQRSSTLLCQVASHRANSFRHLGQHLGHLSIADEGREARAGRKATKHRLHRLEVL